MTEARCGHTAASRSQGRAKVCDFGLAKVKDRTWLSTKNTQAGTPAFMVGDRAGRWHCGGCMEHGGKVGGEPDLYGGEPAADMLHAHFSDCCFLACALCACPPPLRPLSSSRGTP